jgi:hypothetical protein
MICAGLGVAIAKFDFERDRPLIVLPRFSIFSQFLGYASQLVIGAGWGVAIALLL